MKRDYRCYSLQCWITFPDHWPDNAGIPDGHPICGQRIYWMLNYYDSLEALRYFKHSSPLRPATSKWLREKALAYVRRFIPGSVRNICEEYHGTVCFAEGEDDDRTIVHETLHMARHTVDHWFPGRDPEHWEEQMAYVQEYCFEAVRRDLAILRKKNENNLSAIKMNGIPRL